MFFDETVFVMTSFCQPTLFLLDVCSQKNSNIVSKLDTSSPEECCAACAANSACDLFTYAPHEKRRCHLKAGELIPGDYGNCTTGVRLPPAPPGPTLNVALLIVDDLRTDLEHTTDQKVLTPHLLNFASSPSTVTLDRSYVQQGVCSPSRNSFLTGRRPDTTRVWNFERSFRDLPDGPSWVTLPAAFKHAGYLTSGMGKVFHPNRPANDDVPFSWSPQWEYFQPAVDKCNASYPIRGDSWCVLDAPDDHFTDGKIASMAVDRLGEFRSLQSRTGRPFFLALGFHKPHLPNAIPQRYLDMQPPADQIAITPHPYFSHDAPRAAYYECQPMENQTYHFNISSGVPEALQRDYRRAYHAGISFMDAQAGRVLIALETLGLAS
jgi:iduronate 2-sulfatase